jgi:tetratricopeptide (TPR) repeat protein
LFFYGGHLLESTVLNLELYFEHRNYLPAAFLFLPLAVAIRAKLKPLAFAVVFLLITLTLGGFTRYSSSVWSNYPSIVEASARKAPASARAQAEYSVILFGMGRHEDALRVLDRAIEIDANSTFTPLLSVNRLVTLCKMKQLDRAEFEKVANNLSAIPYDARLIKAYTALVDAVVAGECSQIDAMRLNSLFTGMLQVPQNADRSSLEYSHVMYLIGVTEAFSGERQKSIAAFEESLAARPGASHAMQMATILATSGYYADALRFSDIALQQLEQAKTTPLNVVPVGEADVRAFQAIVRADIEAQQGADTSDPVP